MSLPQLPRIVPGIAAALVAVAMLLGPVVGHGHAALMDSSPKAGTTLDVSPAEVSVTFNESVGPVFFRILDRNGREVGRPGEIRLDGERMVMSLGEPLPNGTYLMTYRVISADTHPVGATIPFSVGEPLAAGAATAQAETRSPWIWAVAVNRWILYAGMLLAAGSALFLLLLAAPARVNRAAVAAGRLGAWAALAAFVLAIGVGGAEMLMGPATALLSADAWARGLASTLAASAALGVPAMLLLLWGFQGGDGGSRSLPLGFGAAAAIASFLVTGHAATAPPVWLMATMVGVHLAATAFWLGALYPLYHSTRTESARDAGALMTRFSTLAVPAVIGVVASGAVISWVQLGSPQNFFGNEYGTWLLRKLALVLLLLGFAAYHKWSLTPRLARGDAAASGRMRGSIGAELLVYLLVAGAAMTLTLATPPRALVAGAGGADGAAAPAMPGMSTQGEGYRATVESAEGYSVELDLTPARTGENMLMATVRDPQGQPVTGMADLEVVLALESAGIADVRLKGEDVGDGMWHVMIGEMIVAGQWTLGVDAFVTDYDRIQFETKVDIR